MNLVLFGLLLPTLILFFWQKTNDLKQVELNRNIETMHASLKTRGSSLLSNMALSTNQALASFDFSFINTLIQQVTYSDPELQYCVLMNKQGIAVAHSIQNKVGEQLSGEFVQRAQSFLGEQFPEAISASSITPVGFVQQHQHKGIMEAVAPVYNGSQLWGVLRCAYSLDGLEQQIIQTELKWQTEKDRLTLQFLLIVAVFFSMGIVIAYYFSSRFERAVGKITHGVKAVANGDLEYQIPDKGLLCSEFNSLSSAINQMTDQLYDSRQKLDEYSNTLESQVTERTQELEAANKELESFSYSVSHDLRSPLRSIDGFSQLLLEDYQDKLDDAGIDYLQRVRKGAQHMGDLIESMLNLSKVTRSTLKYSPVNLTKLANEIISQLHENEPDRKVETLIAENLQGQADPNLTRSVLENLIGNAWKYTSKKPIAKIEFGVIQKEGNVFYIKDNGAGFDMKYVDKLFGTFQRLHSASDFSGTGVGLATVQRIINRHGGTIWAEAEIDAGATFFFTLPERRKENVTR